MKLWIKGNVNDISKSCVVKIEINAYELAWLCRMGKVRKETHTYVDAGEDVCRAISVEVK